ncbi:MULTISPECIES: metal-sulfur cluster assembly factor [unclassified Ensifer]|uniref:metal-sulfur cluster assembly factor n=1 Tax=unclassified Ensifer TaxID=2633371 RepID=UPI000813ACC5|nr:MULTISPECIES: metal-sulfur cluster assembly factor [unclassified Ensifer]OCP25059.1 aromatic ring hydroxylase [Ensifer sp. LC54]OCP25278.1 aromatic ring hydroxylase [Ensifer sp. LC384]OCP37699.1 aromatic ring hydroxylase [Ensifer sp. LC163]
MQPTESDELVESIRAALRMIVDPEMGSNVVDLGLIYDISVQDGGLVRVTMTTTIKACPATAFLKEAVQNCVWYVPGVEYAEVRLTYEPPWTPEMMLDAAVAR